MDEREFILKLRKHRLRILLIAVAAFACCAACVYVFEQNGAQVGFKVSGIALVRSADNNSIYQNLFASAEQYEKQRLLIQSDEMISHLVRQFNLYKYYGIDPDSEYAYERIHRRVTSRLTISKKVMDIVAVSFVDRDSRMAVKVLNEMMAKLEKMNRDEVNEMIRTNAEIYEATRQNLSNTFEKKEAEVKDDLATLNRMYDAPRNPKANADLFDMQLSLYRKTNNLEAVKNHIVSTMAKQQVARAAIEKENKSIVRIMYKALPNKNTTWIMMLLGGIAGAVVTMTVLAFILYYHQRYEWTIRTLLS